MTTPSGHMPWHMAHSQTIGTASHGRHAGTRSPYRTDIQSATVSPAAR